MVRKRLTIYKVGDILLQDSVSIRIGLSVPMLSCLCCPLHCRKTAPGESGSYFVDVGICEEGAGSLYRG